MRCPSCGVPITAGPAGAFPDRCPFCKAALGAAASAPDPLAKVREALANGNKIVAIKEYRTIYRVGLAEAKDAVEAMAEGRDVAHPPVPAGAQPKPATATTPGPQSSAIPWMLIVAIVAFAAGLATGLYVVR